jgi:hypothetical protein
MKNAYTKNYWLYKKSVYHDIVIASTLALRRKKSSSKLMALFCNPSSHVKNQILKIKKLDYVKELTSNLNSKSLALALSQIGLGLSNLLFMITSCWWRIIFFQKVTNHSLGKSSKVWLPKMQIIQLFYKLGQFNNSYYSKIKFLHKLG